MWHLVIPCLPYIDSSVFIYLRHICKEQICANPLFRPVQVARFYYPFYFTGALHGTVHQGSHVFVSVRFGFKFLESLLCIWTALELQLWRGGH